MHRDLLSDDIREGAIALARGLIDHFNLNGKDDDAADDEDNSSAIEHATYMQVAPRVGLDPDRLMEDIGTFELHRSRLPTPLFETILMDMDGIMGTECGPPLEKWMVRASSKSFSPVRIIYITFSHRPSKVDHNQQVFDHLVKLFKSTLRNSPKAIGSHSFQAFGAIALLVVEIKLEEGNDAQRLDAISQIIAECESKQHMYYFHSPFPF